MLCDSLPFARSSLRLVSAIEANVVEAGGERLPLLAPHLRPP